VLLHLLVVVAVVFGVNLLPAFGPPTWAVLVFFRFRYPEIPAPALIVAGAVAAASGRLLLALAFRAFGTKLPAKRQESLQVLGHALGETRGGLLASFALFAAAPLPSAQMFEAAGLARIRLAPLLAAFFLGRLVSYSIYVSTASAAHQKLSRLFSKGLFSPQAITTELIGIALVDRHGRDRLALSHRQSAWLVGGPAWPPGPTTNPARTDAPPGGPARAPAWHQAVA
jgi:hypothetical protein